MLITVRVQRAKRNLSLWWYHCESVDEILVFEAVGHMFMTLQKVILTFEYTDESQKYVHKKYSY